MVGSTVARQRQRWGLIAAAAALLAVSGVALAFQGAPVFTGVRFTMPQPDLQQRPGQQQASGTPAPREFGHETRVDLTWVTYTVVILLIIVVLALLWRYVRRRLRPEFPGIRSEVAGSTDGAVAPEPPEQPHPERVRRGLDRALDLLGEGREPRDAIERAWLGLEEGAADSGVHRMPAETPGEFVSRVVARVAADRAAARSLLELYLRARFSEAPVTAADVEAARSAIEALRASWTTAARAGTTGGTER